MKESNEDDKKNGNKKITYTQKQNETAEMCWTHNEDGGHGKLNAHKLYRGQNRQGKKSVLLFDESVDRWPNRRWEAWEREKSC